MTVDTTALLDIMIVGPPGTLGYQVFLNTIFLANCHMYQSRRVQRLQCVLLKVHFFTFFSEIMALEVTLNDNTYTICMFLNPFNIFLTDIG